MSSRVFVSVSGGVVDEVIVPPQINGTWTVIGWDKPRHYGLRKIRSRDTRRPRVVVHRASGIHV